MLDPATSSPSLHRSKTASPRSAGSVGKRIPKSLLKMRRASLASSGKYKLPTVEASALPDNSLAGMATKFRTSSSSGGLPSFCTPMRKTNKTLKVCLDQATGILSKPDLGLDLAGLAAPVKDAFNSENRKDFFKRTRSVDLGGDNYTGGLTSSDMDALMRSGLATPRRTRRSIRLPADTTTTASTSSKRVVSKSKNKTDPLGSSSSHDTLVEQTPRSSSSRRMMRRAKSQQEVSAPSTRRSRRSSRHQQGPPPTRRMSGSTSSRRCRTEDIMLDGSGRSHSARSSSDGSDQTPVPVAPPIASHWTCACGEENTQECKFCGMCGAKQRWECAGCGFANKCKFKFCGMCGIVKTVKGGE